MKPDGTSRVFSRATDHFTNMPLVLLIALVYYNQLIGQPLLGYCITFTTVSLTIRLPVINYFQQ